MNAASRILLMQARQCGKTARADKIATISCMDELQGFRDAAQEFGPPLTQDEVTALAHRARELQRGGR
jgi:hypothetical protein